MEDAEVAFETGFRIQCNKMLNSVTVSVPPAIKRVPIAFAFSGFRSV